MEAGEISLGAEPPALSPAEPTHVVLPLVPALLENNLSRKGVWALNADRENESMEFTYETKDLVGSLSLTFTLGQLATFEMELVAWILGRWSPDQPKITFALRECARSFGTSWGGSRAGCIKDALRRIAGTRMKGRVWNISTRKHTETHFGILDTVEIVDQRDLFESSPSDPGTVSVTLSSFLIEQLVGGQFVRIDWSVFRGKLKTPLARRLYLLVESQQGWAGGRTYTVGIDQRLGATLGTRDAERNPSRLRSNLMKAGEEIVAAEQRYESFEVRRGKKRGDWVLEVKRRATT